MVASVRGVGQTLNRDKIVNGVDGVVDENRLHPEGASTVSATPMALRESDHKSRHDGRKDPVLKVHHVRIHLSVAKRDRSRRHR